MKTKLGTTIRSAERATIKGVATMAVLWAGMATTDAVHAGLLIFSAQSPVNVKAGVSTDQSQYQKGDLIAYDMTTNHVSLYAQILGTTGNLDAVAVLSDGSVVVSTRVDEVLGATQYRAGDLVQYNIQTNTYSLYLKGHNSTAGTDAFGNSSSVFVNNLNVSGGGNPNIDAIDIQVDEFGTTWLYLSTAGGWRLQGPVNPWEKLHLGGGVYQLIGDNLTSRGEDFDNDDIVKYDPKNHFATMLLDFDQYITGQADVKALDWLDDENVLLSTVSSVTLKTGGVFGAADIFKLNTTTGVGTLFFSVSSIFVQTENVNAVDYYLAPVPEPSSLAIFVFGAASLAGCNWRRRKVPVA